MSIDVSLRVLLICTFVPFVPCITKASLYRGLLMVTQERVEKEHLNIYPVLAKLCSDLINAFNLFCLSVNGEKDREDGENFHSFFC